MLNDDIHDREISIATVLEHAIGDKIAYANIYLSEYCKKYTEQLQIQKTLAEQIDQYISGSNRELFDRLCKVDSNKAAYSSWFYYLQGCALSRRCLREGLYPDLTDAMPDTLFQSPDLSASIEYRHYEEMLSCIRQQLQSDLSLEQTDFVSEYLVSCNAINCYILFMMFIQGFQDDAEVGSLEPAQRRPRLEFLQELYSKMAIRFD